VLAAGQPLSVIDVFAPLLEQSSRQRYIALPHSSDLARSTLPTLADSINQQIRQFVNGKDACVIWDGATFHASDGHLFEVIAIVLRVVDGRQIRHILLRTFRIGDHIDDSTVPDEERHLVNVESVNKETLAQLLFHALTTQQAMLGLMPINVRWVQHDRAAVNHAGFCILQKMLRRDIAVHEVFCLSHFANCAGNELIVKKLDVLLRYYFLAFPRHNCFRRQSFARTVGFAPGRRQETRWFVTFEEVSINFLLSSFSHCNITQVAKLFNNWSKFEQWLEEEDEDCDRALENLRLHLLREGKAHRRARIMLEAAVVASYGRMIASICYTFEKKCMLAPFVTQAWSELTVRMQRAVATREFEREVEDTISAIANLLSISRETAMHDKLALLQKVLELQSLEPLSAELDIYIAASKSYKQEDDLWDWWCSQQHALPAWFAIASIFATLPTSSSPAEHAFALLRSLEKSLAGSRDLLINTRLMCKYNSAPDALPLKL
jgi:hypothetical protein